MNNKPKNKIIFISIAIGLMILLTTIARAQTFYTLTESDLTVDENGVITACSYDFEFTDIIVPEEINGVVITGIGDASLSEGVFQDKKITSVQFPSALTSISYGSFHSNQLTNVEFPSSLVSIGDWAFGSNDLTNVEFPSSLISIGDWAFGSNDLTNVEFPSSLISIGKGAFSFNQLTSVSFSSEPSNLKMIDLDAFANNPLLVEITLPIIHEKANFLIFQEGYNNEVTTIRDFTKEYVAKFSAYTLTASNLTVNEDGVIIACSYDFEFTDIIVPEEIDGVVITGIGDDSTEGIFQNKGITSAVLPSSLTYIGRSAFEDNNLTSIKFSSNLVSIGYAAFYSNQLTSVSFSTPSDLKTIGGYAFSNNQGLFSLTLPNDNSDEDFIGYLDSNGSKVQATESGNYSITDFSLGYEVEIEDGSTVLSLSDDINSELVISYPNPVETMLTVERGADFRGDVSLRVFNALGKLVFSRSYSSREKDMKVDFTTMPQGMYLLEVSDGAGSQTRIRIMKN